MEWQDVSDIKEELTSGVHHTACECTAMSKSPCDSYENFRCAGLKRDDCALGAAILHKVAVAPAGVLSIHKDNTPRCWR